jgi:hypothetical protein
VSMAVFDGPPQTVREAIDMGWSGLRIRCAKCSHEGYIPFFRLERRGKDHWLIGLLATRACCRKCTGKPRQVCLAKATPDGNRQVWEERPIEMIGARVLRPGSYGQ